MFDVTRKISQQFCRFSLSFPSVLSSVIDLERCNIKTLGRPPFLFFQIITGTLINVLRNKEQFPKETCTANLCAFRKFFGKINLYVIASLNFPFEQLLINCQILKYNFIEILVSHNRIMLIDKTATNLTKITTWSKAWSKG